MALLAITIIALPCTLLHAQMTPAEREDAREERLKILRAADQIESIQTSSEKLGNEIATLHGEISKLQEANASLQQEVATLKSAFQKAEDARAKEREVLLAKVGEIVAANKPAPEPKKEKPHREKEEPADNSSSTDSERGYYHTVEKGQTLSTIVAAFNDKGIKVTVDDIRKANHLGSNAVLKIGQKLFIPIK